MQQNLTIVHGFFRFDIQVLHELHPLGTECHKIIAKLKWFHSSPRLEL